MALPQPAAPADAAPAAPCPRPTPVPDLPRANAVRVVGRRDPENLARLLQALEDGPAQSLALEPRAERTLHDAVHRPVVKATIDGWCWYLAEDEVDLLVLALRLDPEIVGGPDMPDHRRRQITDLVADAFLAALRQAFDVAARRNGMTMATSGVGSADPAGSASAAQEAGRA